MSKTNIITLEDYNNNYKKFFYLNDIKKSLKLYKLADTKLLKQKKKILQQLLVDYFDAIDNKDPLIKNLHQIKNSRNNYIHNKKSYFSQSDILKISDLMSKLTSSMKE